MAPLKVMAIFGVNYFARTGKSDRKSAHALPHHGMHSVAARKTNFIRRRLPLALLRPEASQETTAHGFTIHPPESDP
jgi:hypothetical protein